VGALNIPGFMTVVIQEPLTGFDFWLPNERESQSCTRFMIKSDFVITSQTPVVLTPFVISSADKNQPFTVAGEIRLHQSISNGGAATVINPETIKSYGGKDLRLEDGDTIFSEGDVASHYFQIVEGSVKMVTVSPEGKEFIQGIFKSGDSFGEPPLFCDFPYPSSACAIGPCTVIKLAKEKFLKLLQENFQAHLLLNQVLCQRLRYKSMVLSEISSYDPEHRIMTILKHLKTEYSPPAPKTLPARSSDKYIVPFTRQQLADMSGLRVETVIRTVKKMDREGKLKLAGRKIAL
jgi:CRP/FNR family cyclic AMP-dependent transcriptional regulator